MLALPALAQAAGRPHPVNNPQSPVMLTGAWVPADPHQIDFAKLPRVPVHHVVVSDARPRNGVNQHNYLVHHDGQFWAMWSDGPEIEDRVGQVVKYATSRDALTWSEPKFMTPYPRNFGPDSPIYNTRQKRKLSLHLARVLGARRAATRARVTRRKRQNFFGPRLELRAFRWNQPAQKVRRPSAWCRITRSTIFPPETAKRGNGHVRRDAQ